MRLGVFVGAALATAGVIASLNWWIDPTHERYHSAAAAAAYASSPPCFVSMSVFAEDTWPLFKLDLFRRRRARIVAVGTSSSGKIGAWPGEERFVNMAGPYTAPNPLLGLFERLAGAKHGRLTVYLGTEPWWFGHANVPQIAFARSRLSSLESLLAGDVLDKTLFILRHAPGAIRHPWKLRAWQREQLARGCAIDQGSALVNGTTNAWAPDGELYFSGEVTGRPNRPSGSVIAAHWSWYVGTHVERDRLEQLRRALAFARRAGWRVVGFAPPIAHRALVRLLRDPDRRGLVTDFRRTMPRVFREYGYPFVDLSDSRSVPCPLNQYTGYDEAHPGPACGMRIRRRLDAAARAWDFAD